MAAIVGLVGEGSTIEVRAMAELMPHRGNSVSCWSPREGVYLGCLAPNDSEIPVGPAVWDEELETTDDDPPIPDLLETLIAHLDRSELHRLGDLRGSFSLAHCDVTSGRVTLATDHVGYKSIYYAVLPTRIAFASEYKAFYALFDFLPEPDRETIQRYQATRACSLTKTFLRGVHIVPPACAVRITNGETQIVPYWRPDVRKTKRSRRDSRELIKSTLVDIIKQQCRGFTRVGLTLSGGLDAPIVAAILRRHAPEIELHGYTIGTDNDDREIVCAGRVADYYGFEHHTAFFKPTDVPARLPALIWLMEDCTGREESLLQHLVYEQMAGVESCVFSGHGADSLFGGMPRHRLIYLAQRLRPFRTALMELFQMTQSGSIPRSALGRVLGRLVYQGKFFAPPRVSGVSQPTRAAEPQDLNSYLADSIMARFSARYLEPLHAITRSVARNPFCRPEMIELAREIPVHQKMGWKRDKVILREAFRDLLPNFLFVQGKAIQRVKHNLELSEVLDEMADVLLTDACIESRGLFDKRYVTQMRRRQAGAPYNTEQIHRLWPMISFEAWARLFLDGREEFRRQSRALRAATTLSGVAEFTAPLTSIGVGDLKPAPHQTVFPESQTPPASRTGGV